MTGRDVADRLLEVITVARHGEELTARCQRADVASDLRLPDLVFPPDAAAAWIHAAYRRCLA